MSDITQKRSVLVTGGNGYIGREVIRRLHEVKDSFQAIVSMDIRPAPEEEHLTGVTYMTGDIRDPDILKTMEQYAVDTVVHLASIVAPSKDSNREFEHSVDVLGTENVVKACLGAGVRHLIVTSSGAAYGFYADNSKWLDEYDPIRGNEEFVYSDHKRQVEELLGRYRESNPELRQLIFRPGTVLGATTKNQITNLFEKKAMIGLFGNDIPFVFVWDEDVANCIEKAILDEADGIYNIAGDGTVSMREIARRLGKPYIPIPVPLMTTAIRILYALGLTRYRPDQVNFLRYRPVLANRRLKEEFGYTPKKTSSEAFDFWLEHQADRG